MDVKPPIHFDRATIKLWQDHFSRNSIKHGRGMRQQFFKGNPFQRPRLQDGEGFLGDLFKQFGLPIITYLGRKGASSAIELGQDLLAGENVKKSLKRRSKQLAQNIASDVAERATRFAQSGSGKKKGNKNKIVLRNTKSNKKPKIKKPKEPNQKKHPKHIDKKKEIIFY
jgi:hypothetical protein